MPQNLTITDADIREIEPQLGEVSFQDEHRTVAIRCSKSCDIQACPGSGKTTLLVAKLAVLARKWRWRDRGILVLSHTKVARHEVQKRLRGTSGYHLLGYPHYVDTIQSFCDRFLALPHLRNSGISDYRIDNELFGRRAVKLLPYYRTAFSTLSRRENSGLNIVRSLRYEGKERKLGAAYGDIPFGLGTPSGKQLVSLKNRISVKDQVFRYDDMFSMAMRYIDQNTWFLPAIRRRFPWVFIDEMQDTDGIQNDLLKLLFGEECVIQRLGDGNQAIFDSTSIKDSSTDFPRDALDLPQSKRFCEEIARLSTPLTVSSPQALVGEPSVASRHHTLFLFDVEHMEAVLPAFGDLLAQEYRDGFPEKFSARAIGARRKPPLTEEAKQKNLPYCLGDYLPALRAVDGLIASSDCLLRFVSKGVSAAKTTGDLKPGWDSLLEGTLELARLAKVPGRNSSRLTKSEMLDALAQNAQLDRFKELMALETLTGSCLQNRERWSTFCVNLTQLLSSAFDSYSEEERASDFMKWVSLNPEPESDTADPNTYIHASGSAGPDIEIGLSTVHAAKGETHTATLVLDTFLQGSHDLKSAIPYLKGSTAKLDEPQKRRLRRVFVAMTRPRELLCLATRKDFVKPAWRKKLENAGWRIVEV